MPTIVMQTTVAQDLLNAGPGTYEPLADAIRAAISAANANSQTVTDIVLRIQSPSYVDTSVKGDGL